MQVKVDGQGRTLQYANSKAGWTREGIMMGGPYEGGHYGVENTRVDKGRTL